MDYNKNPAAYFRQLPIKEMTGQEKFLSLAALIAKGKAGVDIEQQQLIRGWKKTLLNGLSYNDNYYRRAQADDWVDPSSKTGSFVVNERGLDHLIDLESSLQTESTSANGQPALHIFRRKQTHTFDKFLRGVLATANRIVQVADAYAGDVMFDTVLDAIPNTIQIQLLYNNGRDLTVIRARRFRTQFKNFSMKKDTTLHDRFIVVDDLAFVLGPSIKDAADGSPAIVVSLGRTDAKRLRNFFDEQWRRRKATQL